jgi:single-strand DNA-binding protein
MRGVTSIRINSTGAMGKETKPMALNKVMIIGYLGRDPETRALLNGQLIGNFSVATTERFTDRAGTKQEHTEWHSVVAFGRLAEMCGKYLAKGRQIYVEGRLRTREYDSKDGGKRYRTEIIAQRVQFLGAAPTAETTGEEVEGDEEIPF